MNDSPKSYVHTGLLSDILLMNSNNEDYTSTLEFAYNLLDHREPTIDRRVNSITEVLSSYPEDMPQNSLSEGIRSLLEGNDFGNGTCISPLESNLKLNNENLGSTLEDASRSSNTKELAPLIEYAINDSSIEEVGLSLEGAAMEATVQNLEARCKEETSVSCQLLHRKERPSAKSSKRIHKLKVVGVSDRVLRPKLQEKLEEDEPCNNVAETSSCKEKNMKKKRSVKMILEDEYSRVRKQIKYFLNRMSYEQNLIDAYSGDGWRRQSVDKIKPEKELQRAALEIFRCKLKIRDMFQHLDSICAEGRLPEFIFDPAGQIDNKDVFCAKCESKDVCTGNDFVLCDGVCDRGFHQLCIQPPLSLEKIPPHDEGWLCPGCDCKYDCFDLLNDSQGMTLSITDSWEKVFPEAQASSGVNMQEDIFPSDDSEDDDYDPDGNLVKEMSKETDSSSDDSDFTPASDEMGSPAANGEQLLGLPSDDSEDDDYNPTAPDHDEMVNRESSSSDFTSESEELDAALVENWSSTKKESPTCSSLNQEKPLSKGQTYSTPVCGSRHLQRPDYRKLYDEAYTNIPSSSSEDDDWTDNDVPRKMKNNGIRLVAQGIPDSNCKIKKNNEGAKHSFKETKQSFKRCTRPKLNLEGESSLPVKLQKNSLSPGTKKSHGRLGEAITQRLLTSFNENQYPDRVAKENLAEELGILVSKISKWFENTRWSYRHCSSGMAARAAIGVQNKDTSSAHNHKQQLDHEYKTINKLKSNTPKSQKSKRKSNFSSGGSPNPSQF